MHRPDARVIQSGTYGKGFFNLPVVGLHHQCACSVYNAFCTRLYGGGCIVGIYTVSASFGKNYVYPLVVYIVVNSSGSITASANTGYKIIGIVTSGFFFQLPFYFFRDYALHLGHNVGVGVWSHGRTHQIVGVSRMRTPVANGLATGVAQRHVARSNRVYRGSQHAHTLYVGVLTLYIGLAHKYFALHIHQSANGGGGYTMLAGSGFGYDARLAHVACQQYLPDGVVYFVGTRMVQVFALQVKTASVALAHAAGVVQRRGSAYIVAQQLHILTLKVFAVQYGLIGFL